MRLICMLYLKCKEGTSSEVSFFYASLPPQEKKGGARNGKRNAERDGFSYLSASG